MVDVAIAGSAAPLLFPIAEIDDRLYADGAFFANSPELVGLHEAETFLGQPPEEVRVLTVGTTTAKISQGHAKGRDWGAVDWVDDFRILEFLMASQVGVVREMVRQRLPDRYFVIDSDRGRYASDDLGMTSATPSAISTLRSLGKEAAKRALGDPSIRRLFEHEAPPPKFFSGPNKSEGAGLC